MRTIKFRAWDEEEKKMYPVTAINMNDKGKIITAILKDRKKFYDVFHLMIKFMQFTGLKDKNGKEIYEGDIVKIFDVFGKHEKDVEKIIFNNGTFQTESYGAMCRWFDIIDSDVREVEVIGNIYENPENLK